MAISSDNSTATNFWVSLAIFAVASFIYFDRDHIFRRSFRAWLQTQDLFDKSADSEHVHPFEQLKRLEDDRRKYNDSHDA